MIKFSIRTVVLDTGASNSRLVGRHIEALFEVQPSSILWSSKTRFDLDFYVVCLVSSGASGVFKALCSHLWMKGFSSDLFNKPENKCTI